MARKRRQWTCALVALVTCGSCAGAGGAAARVVAEGSPGEITALHVAVPGPPRHVYASDGREHVEYDLVITNAFTSPATLESLTVTGGGRTLLRHSKADVAAATHEVFAGDPSGHDRAVGDRGDRRRHHPPGVRRTELAATRRQPGPLFTSRQRDPPRGDREHDGLWAEAHPEPACADRHRLAGPRGGLGRRERLL